MAGRSASGTVWGGGWGRQLVDMLAARAATPTGATKRGWRRCSGFRPEPSLPPARARRPGSAFVVPIYEWDLRAWAEGRGGEREKSLKGACPQHATSIGHLKRFRKKWDKRKNSTVGVFRAESHRKKKEKCTADVVQKI